jgi:apolipoprotein N-acyltransferase
MALPSYTPLPRQAWPWAGAIGSAMLMLVAAPGIAPWRACSWLAWVAFVPTLWALGRVSRRRAALLGWVAGLALNAGLCVWFPGLLARFSGLPAAVAVAMSLLLWSWQALAWSAWALFACETKRSAFAPIACAAAFVVIERWMPMVFPYSLGITQYRQLPIAQAAELGGPYLLTFLFVLTATGLVGVAQDLHARRAVRRAFVLIAIVTPVATFLLGASRQSAVERARALAPALRVGVVQANEVRTGWRAKVDAPDILSRYQRLSTSLERAHGKVDLIVWPEKAYPLLLRHDAAHDYPRTQERRVRVGFESTLLFGANAVDASTRALTNSAVLLRADDGMEVFYDKVRLIPYSEWLPGWIASRLARGKRYQAGANTSPVKIKVAAGASTEDVAVGVFICFESTFPSFVRSLVAHEPQLLVNLSDDSWFGDGAEPDQHLAQVVFRAIESRRDIVRATGSGISALVSASGEVVAATQVSRAGEGDNTTLFVEPRRVNLRGWYGRLGDGFAYGCLLVTLAALLDARRRSS